MPPNLPKQNGFVKVIIANKCCRFNKFNVLTLNSRFSFFLLFESVSQGETDTIRDFVSIYSEKCQYNMTSLALRNRPTAAEPSPCLVVQGSAADHLDHAQHDPPARWGEEEPHPA